jgi:hypothetical protein
VEARNSACISQLELTRGEKHEKLGGSASSTGKCKFKSHFIDNAGDPEGAQFFIIKLFAGACGG